MRHNADRASAGSTAADHTGVHGRERRPERLRRGVILTDATVLGLFYIQRYRFLTIPQFARAANLHPVTAARQLRALELHGLLGHFGGIAIPGYGGTPKAYFLTRKGWEILSRESDIPPELIGSHKEIKVEAR